MEHERHLSLQPTLFPDVDFIALTGQLDGDEQPFELLGFIEAIFYASSLVIPLRAQIIFGHRTWVYVGPGN